MLSYTHGSAFNRAPGTDPSALRTERTSPNKSQSADKCIDQAEQDRLDPVYRADGPHWRVCRQSIHGLVCA